MNPTGDRLYPVVWVLCALLFVFAVLGVAELAVDGTLRSIRLARVMIAIGPFIGLCAARWMMTGHFSLGWRLRTGEELAQAICAERDNSQNQLSKVGAAYEARRQETQGYHDAQVKRLHTLIDDLIVAAERGVRATLRAVHDRAMAEGIFAAWSSALDALAVIISADAAWQWKGGEWRIVTMPARFHDEGDRRLRTERYVEVSPQADGRVMLMEHMIFDGKYDPPWWALWVSPDGCEVGQGPIAGHCSRQPDGTWKND